MQKPEKDEWGSALEAFQAALALEKFNNQSLLELHAIAQQHNDSQVCQIEMNRREISYMLDPLKP